MSNRAGRLRVGVIGSGRVGPVLALALAGAGHELVGITAAGDDAKSRVAAMLPNLPIAQPDELIKNSQLVVFAIPGSELPAVVDGFTRAKLWQPGQLVMHTAPEHGYLVFGPAMAQGVIPLAVHPGIVFTGTSMDLIRLKEAVCAVTAPDPVLPIAQALAVEMGAEPLVIAEADRAAYADSVQAACELGQAVVKNAKQSLAALGVADPQKLLAPLLHAAVDEALRSADT